MSEFGTMGIWTKKTNDKRDSDIIQELNILMGEHNCYPDKIYLCPDKKIYIVVIASGFEPGLTNWLSDSLKILQQKHGFNKHDIHVNGYSHSTFQEKGPLTPKEISEKLGPKEYGSKLKAD